jgi:hypothetical protein
MVKCKANVVNGVLGMKRDANLLSIVFFHSYEDTREVLFGYSFNIFYAFVYM